MASSGAGPIWARLLRCYQHIYPSPGPTRVDTKSQKNYKHSDGDSVFFSVEASSHTKDLPVYTFWHNLIPLSSPNVLKHCAGRLTCTLICSILFFFFGALACFILDRNTNKCSWFSIVLHRISLFAHLHVWVLISRQRSITLTDTKPPADRPSLCCCRISHTQHCKHHVVKVVNRFIFLAVAVRRHAIGKLPL